MNRTDIVDRAQIRKDIPPFAPGDTIKVHVRVVEGNRERVQLFQGVVTSRKGAGARETFTVRKLSFGVGVERTFPLHSPVLAKIEIVAKGQVRRAKLYYLRDRVGRAAKIRERRNANLDELNALATTADEQDPAEAEAFAELAADAQPEQAETESPAEETESAEPAAASDEAEPAEAEAPEASEDEAVGTPAE